MPPAEAINFAATLVPTIAETLGAIKSILFSRKLSILCLLWFKSKTSWLSLITSLSWDSDNYTPVEAENETVTLMIVEFGSHFRLSAIREKSPYAFPMTWTAFA